MNVKSLCASLCLLAMLFSTTAYSQSDIADKDRAVISFDFQVGKLRDSALAEAMDMEQQMSNMQMGGPMDAEVLSKLERVFGSASAPPDFMSVMGMGPGGELPMQFFVRFQFSDADAASAMISEIQDESEGEEIDGRTYYRPPDGEPQNIVATQIDDKTIELGTEAYVFESGREFGTESLSNMWNEMPNTAIRIAMDLDGASDFVNEAIEMGKEGAPPMAKPMLDLVTKASSLQMIMDADSENLMMLVVTGKDEEQAEEIRGGLDGILGMAKFAGMQGIQDLREQDEEAADVAKEIMDSLTATRDGSEVKVTIPRPEGFEDFVKKMQKMMPNSGAAADDFLP